MYCSFLGRREQPFTLRCVKGCSSQSLAVALGVQVPGSASDIFQHADKYRQQIASLDLMVTLYNKLQRTILPVERPLVSAKLDAAGGG